jgi:hypothetical protein
MTRADLPPGAGQVDTGAMVVMLMGHLDKIEKVLQRLARGDRRFAQIVGVERGDEPLVRAFQPARVGVLELRDRGAHDLRELPEVDAPTRNKRKCGICGKPLRGKQRDWCSNAHKVAGHRRRMNDG